MTRSKAPRYVKMDEALISSTDTSFLGWATLVTVTIRYSTVVRQQLQQTAVTAQFSRAIHAGALIQKGRGYQR